MISYLVISLTYRCNSRCLTCLEWETPETAKNKELTLIQYKNIFESWQGKIPYLSVAGGEAFLRKDLPQIILLAAQFFKPKAINIATNGLLPEKIASDTEKILEKVSPKTIIIVNLSIDGTKTVHNRTRRGKDFFKRLMSTHQKLKNLQNNHPNLKIAFHTGLSLFNKNAVPSLLDLLNKLKPYSYILEPAIDRQELLEKGIKIEISTEDFRRILKLNLKKIWELNRNLSLFLKIGRLGYYPFALEVLEKSRQAFPCQAASSALFLNPYGNLSPCEFMSPFANLANFNYNLKRACFSLPAQEKRTKIQGQQCFCSSSYGYYSSIKKAPWYLLRAFWRLIRL